MRMDILLCDARLYCFSTFKEYNMTEAERTSLIKEIKDFDDWMKESSACNLHDTDITELVEDDSDVYEVLVRIHLNNGEHIILHNHCYNSFVRKRYCGDTMHYLGEGVSSDINSYDYVEICYDDMQDGTYHQCIVPLSSICYTEGYSICLNWPNLYEHIWKKRNGE